jgi:Cu/Ag efflux protein CusF
MKKKLLSLLVMGTLSFAGGVAAQDKAKPAPEKAKAAAPEKGKPLGAMEYVKVTATVESVDQATRAVTLKGSNGDMVSFVAGPDVKNLAQVSKGDIVTIEYAQAVLVGLEKSPTAKRERLVTEAKKGAPVGSMPAGVVVRDVSVVASVEAIDTAKSLVTLRGPENTVTLKVADPAVLKAVKVGDFVKASYTEAMAIRVDKAPAPAAAPKK